MDLNAGIKEVLDRSTEIMQEIKKEEDHAIISHLADSLKSNGNGVSGIDETLSSLYEGAGQTLILDEGFTQKGVFCPACGFMALSGPTCPICNKSTVCAPDILERAVVSAVGRDCEIVHVGSESGIRQLGSVGALLRYKPALGKKPEERRLEENV
jgi:hypothetical protein